MGFGAGDGGWRWTRLARAPLLQRPVRQSKSRQESERYDEDSEVLNGGFCWGQGGSGLSNSERMTTRCQLDAV